MNALFTGLGAKDISSGQQLGENDGQQTPNSEVKDSSEKVGSDGI